MTEKSTTAPKPPGLRRWMTLGAVAVGVAVVFSAAMSLVSVWRETDDSTPFVQAAPEAPPEVADWISEANLVAAEALELYPDSPEAMGVVARLHERFGHQEDAANWWKRALESAPEFTPAYDGIAHLALQQGDHATAAEHFRSAARLNPESSVFPALLGECLIEMGQVKEAVQVLEENRNRFPRSMPTLTLLGQAYFRQREYEKSRQCLETAVEIAPDYTSAYYTLGRACAELGDREKSLAYLERFKQLKEQDAEDHRTRLEGLREHREVRQGIAGILASAARVHVAHGNVERGEQLLQQGIRISPEGTENRQVLAWLYARQGKPEEARELISFLEDRAQDDLELLLGVADLYLELNDNQGAIDVYRRVIGIAPEQSGGYAALAELYLAIGGAPAQARDLAAQAVRLEPRAKYYFLLALACRRSGDRDGALEAIDNAIRLEPAEPRYRELRAAMRGTG